MVDFKTELRFEIDLDRERKVEPRANKPPNVHRVTIRKSKPINLEAVSGYLDGTTTFDNSVLEAISLSICRSGVSLLHTNFW